jgi:hypothetical protein
MALAQPVVNLVVCANACQQYQLFFLFFLVSALKIGEN